TETSMRRLWKGEADSLRWKKLYLHKRGHAVWADAIISMVRDARGEPLYTLGQIHDVTGLRKVEEALRESEVKFRTTFESAASGMTLTDKEGRFVSVNRTFREMLGYSEEELLALTRLDITIQST
ncbi:MAG: PAS domain S-box protein, partial [Phycisphaerae bacterium]|nr:PAS domain S-box protein [Phycisphaerae bacterium]